MHFLKLIILIVISFNLCTSRPIQFDTLANIIKGHNSELSQAKQVTESSKITQEMSSKESSIKNEKSIFEEHPWLDNALTLLVDKLFRLLVILLKKFVFKMEVNMSDFL